MKATFERAHYERLADDYWGCWGVAGEGFLLVAQAGNVFGWSRTLPAAASAGAGSVSVSWQRELLVSNGSCWIDPD